MKAFWSGWGCSGVPSPSSVTTFFPTAEDDGNTHHRVLRLARILHHRRGAALEQLGGLGRDGETTDLSAPLDEVEVHFAGRLAHPVRFHELPQSQSALGLHARLGLLRGLLAPLLGN